MKGNNLVLSEIFFVRYFDEKYDVLRSIRFVITWSVQEYNCSKNIGIFIFIRDIFTFIVTFFPQRALCSRIHIWEYIVQCKDHFELLISTTCVA